MSSDVFCTSPAKTRANGVRRRENEKNAAGKGAGCHESKKSGPACRTGTIRTGSGAADFRLNPVIRLADTARYLQNRKLRERRQKHERETAGKGNPAPRRGVCFDVCGSARGFECHARGTQCRRLNATLHDSFMRPNFTGKQAIACVPPWRRHSACSLSMNMLLMV